MSRQFRFSLFLCLLLAIGASAALHAQDATSDPPQPISVSHSEPTQFTNGQAGILSVFGANFTADTTIRLVGMGLLPVTFVNSGALTAALPSDLPTGQYTIEVSAPGGGTVASPNTLTVVAPVVLPTAAPPTLIPTTAPTLEPPTPIPGQPSLIVRDFAAIPSIVAPGGPVGLTFVLLNQGNRTAQGVSVALDSGGKFYPAAGQAGAALPDLPPGSSVQVTLSALAARDAAEGPTNIPITMAYRDFEGKTYTAKADLAVEIAALNEMAQVTLVRYVVEPALAVPGAPVTIRVTVSNSGNATAAHVLLRIAGEKNVLLAGEQGDSFPIGDIAAGQSVTVDLPLVVNPEADAGPQSQPVTLSYLQSAAAKDTTTSMTIEVARVTQPEALILLASYSTGDDEAALHPGDRFTLKLTLNNVGSADAVETLVTFGTVDVPPASSGDTGSGSGSGSSGSGSSSSGSGGAFAPLGAGDTLFLGTVGVGASIALEQEFIVNSSVTSGIYSLPITVRYQKSDGSAATQNLRASVIVVAPLRVQTSLASPLPETANVGEPLPVSLKVANHGTSAFNVTAAAVTAENAELLDGANTLLSPIKADKDETISATILPSAAGEYSVTFTLTYTDDLNRVQTLTQTFSGQAVVPPEPELPPDMPVTPAAAPEEENFLGRLLLGFLGLGG